MPSEIPPRLRPLLLRVTNDLAAYRGSLDKAFSDPNIEARQWRVRLGELLHWTTRLYLDYVTMLRIRPMLESAARRHRRRRPEESNGVAREAKMRHQLAEILENAREWGPADGKADPMVTMLGLRSRKDCADRMSVDLAEIYEETIHTEIYLERYLDDRGDDALIYFFTGMEHLARNHAIFVIPALEWAADLRSAPR